MLEIVLTDDQARVVTSALKPVQVRDRKGNVLGTIAPAWTAIGLDSRLTEGGVDDRTISTPANASRLIGSTG